MEAQEKVLAAIDGIKATVATKDELTKAMEGAATKAELQTIANDLKAINESVNGFKLDKAKPVSTVAAISKAFEENYNAKKGQLEATAVPFRTKSVITAADNLDGDTVITYDSQVAANPYRNVHFRNLATIIPSATGTFSWYRQKATTGAIAFQTTHGLDKSNIAPEFEQDSVVAEYLAGLAPVAKQMVQDLPFMQGFMPQFMVDEYLTKEDEEFFDELVLKATGSNTTTGANEIEEIMEWVANLRSADHSPNGIVMHPADVYKVFVTTVGDAGYTLPPGVTVANNGLISIFGLPVFQTTFVSEGTVLVGDWSRSRIGIVQVDGLSVQTDDKGHNFDQNTITFKAEARVALAVLRPDAFVVGTLTSS